VDVIDAFSHLFGQTVAQSLVAVSSTLGQFKISGFICREAHHQKNLQFIYVNKRLILKSKLHRLANSMLGNSFILKKNATSHDIPISKEISIGNWLALCPPQKREKYAVYLLNVECPYHVYDISFDPKKTLIEFSDWDEVLLCMEMAIRTFLEMEYALNFSQESNIYSPQEKNNSNNISIHKKMRQLEKGYALGQLKTQHSEPTEVTMGDISDTHGHSEAVTKKMLNVSRAVFGMPAKRRDKNEDVCYEDNLYLQSRALTFEETDVESEITVVVESGANRSNKTALPNFTPPALGRCNSEDPFSCSETHHPTQKSKTPMTNTLNNSVVHTGRRNSDFISDFSDIPLIESNCEKESVQCRLAEADLDLYPVQRFRNFINHRTQPKYHSKHTDLPPITKFREAFQCVSNIQIPMPLKKFEFNVLRQYLGTSQLLKEGVNANKDCDEPNVGVNLKNATVGGHEIAQRNVCRYKDANGILSSKVSTNLKYLLEEIAKRHADMNNVYNGIHSNRHNNYKVLVDHSVQHPSVQDDCKRSSLNVAKHTTQSGSTERTEVTISNCEANTCPSSSFRGPLCNESNNIPNNKTIKVEECAQTFDLTFEAGKVEKHISNTQHHHSTHKKTDEDVAGRDKLLTENNNKQVHNWLKIMYPKSNDQDCDTNIYRENNSSRNYFTSSDFLCTFERERVKEIKFTTQNIIPVCQTTEFQNERCARVKACSCCEKSHNMLAYKKAVHFNPIDRRIGSTVRLSSSPGNSDGVLHTVSVVEECVSPDLGAVTFRISPKVDLMHSLGCRNVLTFLSSNEGGAYDGKLMKNLIQHSDYMKNHCVDNYTKGIPRVVLSSGNALNREQLGINTILSSGSEADVESSSDIQPWTRKRRRVTMLSFNNMSGNKRFSNHKLNPKYVFQQAQHINGNCSEESLKRKICYPLEKCGSWKWHILSRKQHDEEASEFIQGEENYAGHVSSSRHRSRSKLDSESPQMSVHERVSQILESSNDTIVPSSCSIYNSSLSHFHQTDNCKMIISDSCSDLSLNECNVTSSEVPGNLQCVENRLAASNGNETQSEICCSQLLCHEFEDAEMTVETDDIIIPCGQIDSSEVRTEAVGVLNGYVYKETSSENVRCLEVCTELSPITLSNVISTSKIACISELPSKEYNSRMAGNENNISETENIDSDKKCNVSQELLSPKFTAVCEDSKYVTNETEELDDANKNNYVSKSSSNIPVKCGVSSSHQCNKDEASQLPFMKNVSSEQEQFFASKGNNEGCGASRTCNCSDGESTHLLAKEEMSAGGVKRSNQEYSLVKESLLSDTELYHTTYTFSLLKKNDVPSSTKDVLADSGSISNGLGLSPTNGRSPTRNNGESYDDKFAEVTSAQTSKQNSILTSEGLSKEHYDLLHLVSCADSVGQHVQEKQSHLFDRKRRSEIECKNVYGKRNCMEKLSGNVSIPKYEPCENNAIVSTVCMSNSISTQDLNEAFDNVMSKIAECNTNKQENYVSIAGQDNTAVHTLGDTTVAMDVCKETNKRNPNSEDIDITCPKAWKEKLDLKGKNFFVHVESGLTSYTVPNMLTAQNLYSMSTRFSFLPKGMSPILKNGVNKSCKESEENTLTPASHQALCSVITESYSAVDELATVKWKDIQETKGTGNVTHIHIYINIYSSFFFLLYMK
jgi:hypothetical protein